MQGPTNIHPLLLAQDSGESDLRAHARLLGAAETLKEMGGNVDVGIEVALMLEHHSWLRFLIRPTRIPKKLAAELLTQTDGIAHEVADALSTSKLQYPRQKHPGAGEELPTTDPLYTNSKSLSRLLLARARWRYFLGDKRGSLNELINALNLATALRATQASMMGYIVGAAAHNQTLREIERLARNSKKDTGLLRRILTLLPDPEINDPFAAGSLRSEFNSWFVPEVMSRSEAFLALGLWGPAQETPGVEMAKAAWPTDQARIIDREETIRLGSLIFAAEIAMYSVPWRLRPKERQSHISQVFASLKWLKTREGAPPPAGFDDVWAVLPKLPRPEDANELARHREAVEKIPNALGLAVLRSLSFYGIPAVSLRIVTEVEVIRALLGIRVFENEQRQLPRSLSDLVTLSTLEAVPMDPASGSALKYSPRLRLIWSVGPDGSAVRPPPQNPKIRTSYRLL